jgi:hypothetical protein
LQPRLTLLCQLGHLSEVAQRILGTSFRGRRLSYAYSVDAGRWVLIRVGRSLGSARFQQLSRTAGAERARAAHCQASLQITCTWLSETERRVW